MAGPPRRGDHPGPGTATDGERILAELPYAPRRGRLAATLAGTGRALRRHPWRVAAVVVVVWGTAAVADLWRARGDALEALERVERFREAAEPRTLLNGEQATELAVIARTFDRARDRTRSPWVSPLRALPVLGRQIRSVDALATAGRDLARAGADALERVADATARTPATGPGRLTLLREVSSIVAGLRETVAHVDLGPGEALVGTLADARARLASELEDLGATLDDAAVGVSGAIDLLEGPATYLLFAANNAEMRAGAGMFLQVGTVSFEAGEVLFGEMQSVGDLVFDEPVVPLPPEMEALWGWAHPTEDWRNLMMSPRFGVSAELAAAMWEVSGRGRVDGVAAVDVVALQRIVEVTGPVTVLGETVGADELIDVLTRRQYERPRDLQDERREELGDVAVEVMQRLLGGDVALAEVADALADAAAGRHLLVWSPDPEQSAAWEAAGVTGELTGDSVLVSFLNTGANKLDPYTVLEARLTRPAPDRLELEVTVENRTPARGISDYALSNPDVLEDPRMIRGVLAVNLPGWVRTARIDGVDGATAAGPDGPTVVLADTVTLRPGEMASRRFVMEVPDGPLVIRVEPSARIPPVRWTVGERTFRDVRARTVRLPPPAGR